MKKDLVITAKMPYPMGVRRTENGISVCATFQGGKNPGIVLFGAKGGRKKLVKFTDSQRFGKVYSALITGDTDNFSHYMLIEDGKLFCDPYARYVDGLEKWGKNIQEADLRCRIDDPEYDWDSDKRPHTSYEDSFVYTLHVRGYTRSPSSGIEQKKRGTYAGLVEKIDYLKSLGVTAVELMPAYEMSVLDHAGKHNGNGVNMPEGSMSASQGKDNKKIMISENGTMKDAASIRHKINFWGYKKGLYFAPRTAYSYRSDAADLEFKDMVRSFHKNGIEVIMQFYFEGDASEDLIISAIRHWVFNYHIDGVHIKGYEGAPGMIANDPALSDIKIWYYGFDYGKIYCGKGAGVRTLGEFRPDFMYATRRFLKGDDNALGDFIRVMLNNPADAGAINYICDYEGFRLADLVSYEHKRNELNGENNTDGTSNNLSWNCGAEGKTRKQSILTLRNRQMKNALTMIFFSQGTPMLFGGDEFGNSQDGNNNPYCQDNATGWVDWRESQKPQGQELINYVRFLSSLRKKYKILHESKAFKLMDYKSCGYPDLSYHGKEAWRPDLSNYSHSIGMLYCGFYEEEEKEQDFFYVVYNMHWTPVSFALPKLPEGMRWNILNDTEDTEEYKRMHSLKDQENIECTERSVKILIGVGKPIKKQVRKGKSSKTR